MHPASCCFLCFPGCQHRLCAFFGIHCSQSMVVHLSSGFSHSNLVVCDALFCGKICLTPISSPGANLLPGPPADCWHALFATFLTLHFQQSFSYLDPNIVYWLAVAFSFHSLSLCRHSYACFLRLLVFYSPPLLSTSRVTPASRGPINRDGLPSRTYTQASQSRRESRNRVECKRSACMNQRKATGPARR